MLVVIPCGAKKLVGTHRAWKLYKGPYYSACLKYALSIAPPRKIFILSAKYGLCSLEKVLTCYDLKMGQPGSVSLDTIRRQYNQIATPGEPVLVLGGRLYVQAIVGAVGGPVVSLVSHMGEHAAGMGRQMQWLKKNMHRIPDEVRCMLCVDGVS